MADFGFTSIGANDATTLNPVGSKFTAPASGTITAMATYLAGTVSDKLRTAIFADAAGSPAGKLAESDEVATSGAGWKTTTISLAITSGTVYWLMAWTESGDNGKYDTPGDVTDQTAYQLGLTYPTWPDPFNEDGFLDRKMSIYATYTPAGSGAPCNLLMLGAGKCGDVSAAGLIVGGPAFWRYRRMLRK